MPAWDPEVRQYIDLCLRNTLVGFDAHSVEAPHGYGPSLRYLWAQAKRRRLSDREALHTIVAWAHHRPAAWDAEDRRRKKGSAQAQAAASLRERLAREVAWVATGDLDYPWAADVDGERWRVRLNDFPDEVMYTLVIGDAAAGDFHDWPERWHRE